MRLLKHWFLLVSDWSKDDSALHLVRTSESHVSLFVLQGKGDRWESWTDRGGAVWNNKTHLINLLYLPQDIASTGEEGESGEVGGVDSPQMSPKWIVRDQVWSCQWIDDAPRYLTMALVIWPCTSRRIRKYNQWRVVCRCMLARNQINNTGIFDDIQFPNHLVPRAAGGCDCWRVGSWIRNRFRWSSYDRVAAAMGILHRPFKMFNSNRALLLNSSFLTTVLLLENRDGVVRESNHRSIDRPGVMVGLFRSGVGSATVRGFASGSDLEFESR
jgi:hypothetical protein